MRAGVRDSEAIEFFSFLRLIEGENADRVFRLEPYPACFRRC